MKLCRNFYQSERGTVAVMMAVAMFILAGFTALVTDAGLLYLNQGKLENGLDSAVLAGVQELPVNPQGALDVAMQYAELNGMQAGEVIFQLGSDNRSISGSATRRVGMFFARVLGVDGASVQASSRARVIPVSAADGVVPFGVLDYDFAFGDEVILKEGASENLYAGWFGALRLGGNGASVYLENVKYGYDGEIKIGDVIPTEPGNMSGPTEEGIEYRIDQCYHSPACTIDCFQEGCPRILLVPIVDIEEMDNGGHVFSVRVVGFGAFLVDEYVGHGNDNEVKGAFIRYVIPGTSDEDASDCGLYGAQLCE